MAVKSGKFGTVKSGATEFPQITEWEFTGECNVPKWNSNTSNGFKVGVNGAYDGNGSFTCKYDELSPLSAVLLKAADPPEFRGDNETALSVTLFPDKNSPAVYTVPILVKQVRMRVNIDEGDPPEFQVEFTSQGKWVDNT